MKQKLVGALSLLAFYYAGQYLSARFQLSVPGNVLGMFMLLLFLIAWRRVPAGLDAVTPPLLGSMVLYFMPAAVGVMILGPLLMREGMGIVFTMVVSTVVPLFVLGHGLDRWLARRGQRV
jgi:holin-like protein